MHAVMKQRGPLDTHPTPCWGTSCIRADMAIRPRRYKRFLKVWEGHPHFPTLCTP